MKTYMQRAGIIGSFLFLMYIIMYMVVSRRAGKSFPERLADQEVVGRRLDRIEQTLNKLAKLIEVSGRKSSGPNVDQEKAKIVLPKLYPHSVLFAKWGDSLSEKEQKEAQALFQSYGYNVFLIDQLPLDRKVPDTRDNRCLAKIYPKDLPTASVILIYVNEALPVIKRAIRSIITHTHPKHLLKEIIRQRVRDSNHDAARHKKDCHEEIGAE